MNADRILARIRARELAQHLLAEGDFSGFFDAVYAAADNDPNGIPWADLRPHPIALSWLEQQHIQGQRKRALVIGCGLGDDAEELAARGFQVTAFDVAPRAIAWCQQRFPGSTVTYQTADLLATPNSWQQAFDFTLEVYTLQALPVTMRTQAINSVAQLVAPGGRLLVVCRGRDTQDDPGKLPWPLSRDELANFQAAGLREISFEDITGNDSRHFRAVYER